MPVPPGDPISTEAPLIVYPPGPFPPHGRERAGTIDLGIRLRDLLYRRSLIEGPVRNAFVNRLGSASADPQSLMMALPTLDNLIDTWPLAHLVDNARNAWTEGPDGNALAVLARSAHVVSGVLGFPQVIDGRWPMPDVDWIREMTGPGPHAVMSRGPKDGAPGTTVVLNARKGGNEPVDLPPVLVTHGDIFVEQLGNLLSAVQSGEAVAVRFETPHKWDEASLQALEALRAAAPAQRAFDRYGHAGLVAPDAPSWDDLLQDPPPGTPGPVLTCTCEVLLLPTLSEEGTVQPFGALVWDAPYRPLRVIAAAAEILRRLDGVKDTAAVAKEVNAAPGTVQHLLDQLITMGACTAAQ